MLTCFPLMVMVELTVHILHVYHGLYSSMFKVEPLSPICKLSLFDFWLEQFELIS